MKKGAILLLAAVLLCTALTACGTTQNGGTSGTSSTTNNAAGQATSTTGSDMMNGTPRDEMNTVSEWFSEGMSDLGDSSFLDPQNGIISDTQAAQ